MNNKLQEFARKEIKSGLANLPEGSIRIFKLMYGRNNGKRSVEAAIALSIDEIVDSMPFNKLDWAMQQVQSSLDKQQRRADPNTFSNR